MSSTDTMQIRYLLRLADNALILSHRLSEWAGHGPILEEDIALSNIALDLLGQARLLYQHVAALEGGRGEAGSSPTSASVRTEDHYAYWRDVGQFSNFTMLELPNSGVASAGPADGDYAFTIVRNALYSHWALLAWQRLLGSNDAQLAAIAGKAVKETRYHVRHADDWMVRLGDGTLESHDRTQRALDSLVPYCNEWFSADALDARAADSGLGFDPAQLRADWEAAVRPVAQEATLQWPKASEFVSQGKQGVHGEHLGFLLAEMQSLARQHPGATW